MVYTVAYHDGSGVRRKMRLASVRSLLAALLAVTVSLLACNGLRSTAATTTWHRAQQSFEQVLARGLGDYVSIALNNARTEDATDVALRGFTALFSDPAPNSQLMSAQTAVTTLRPANNSSCLISKWSAVWLVHKDGTRSHVGFPTPGCESRAAPVDDLSPYAKAHGGEGDYFLDRVRSEYACMHDECLAPSDGRSTSGVHHPLAPSHGWGAGVLPGGAWMAASNLRFNKPATAMFESLVLSQREPLLIVFGGASVTDMLRNWAQHVQRLGMPFTVACMDETLFNEAQARGYAAVMMQEGGRHSAITTRWKYYRMVCLSAPPHHASLSDLTSPYHVGDIDQISLTQ